LPPGYRDDFRTAVGKIWRHLNCVRSANAITEVSGEAHNAANYAKLKDWYRWQEEVSQLSSKEAGLHRPYIRQAVGIDVEANAQITSKGLFRDANDLSVAVGREYHLGHAFGYEYRRLELYARLRGMSQAEFNNFANNPRFYQIESPANNLGHFYEKPGIDITDLIREFGW
jgi:hypothetical protein